MSVEGRVRLKRAGGFILETPDTYVGDLHNVAVTVVVGLVDAVVAVALAFRRCRSVCRALRPLAIRFDGDLFDVSTDRLEDVSHVLIDGECLERDRLVADRTRPCRTLLLQLKEG